MSLIRPYASLSVRRAWIEIAYGALDGASEIVALRKESVDRNLPFGRLNMLISLSLSVRRAWIEMSSVHEVFANFEGVALRKESVDRNGGNPQRCSGLCVALRKESVDRNIVGPSAYRTSSCRSP